MKKILLTFLCLFNTIAFAESSATLSVSARVLATGKTKIDIQSVQTDIDKSGHSDRYFLNFKTKTNTGLMPVIEFRLARESRDVYMMNGQMLSTTSTVRIHPNEKSELVIIRAEKDLEFPSNLIMATTY